MAVLFYNDPNLGWTNLAQGPTGPTGPAGPTGPVGVSQDANNAATLGTDGLIYVPQIGGVTGSIVMYAGASAPAGWALCDGSVHGSPALEAILGSVLTPDLRDRFVRGAGLEAVGTTGGANIASLNVNNLPSHDHTGMSGNQSVDHTHGGTSGAMSANSTHTHAGTSGGESVEHVHSVPQQASGGQSANHTHTVYINEGSGEAADGAYVDSNPTSQSRTYTAGVTGNPSANHTHTSSAINTGGRSAAHTHGLNLAATSTAHTHPFTSAGASATHAHTIPAQGDGTPLAVTPAYVALSFIIKL